MSAHIRQVTADGFTVSVEMEDGTVYPFRTHPTAARLFASSMLLYNACRALLLFHSSSPWTESKREEWVRLTGQDEATTRVLCDTARAALDAAWVAEGVER